MSRHQEALGELECMPPTVRLRVVSIAEWLIGECDGGAAEAISLAGGHHGVALDTGDDIGVELWKLVLAVLWDRL